MGGVGLASVLHRIHWIRLHRVGSHAVQMRMDPHALAMVSAIADAASAISVSLVRPVLPM